jgi:hypothetical protein
MRSWRSTAAADAPRSSGNPSATSISSVATSRPSPVAAANSRLAARARQSAAPRSLSARSTAPSE